MTEEKNNKKTRRKFLEIDQETARKIQIYCFLRNTSIKQFVTKTMQKELQPYEQWLEDIKKLKVNI